MWDRGAADDAVGARKQADVELFTAELASSDLSDQRCSRKTSLTDPTRP